MSCAAARLALVLAALAALAAGCASSPRPAPESSSPAVLPTLSTSPEPASAAQVQKAELFRSQGLELLYSKDPLVKNEEKAKAKFEEAAALGDPVSMDQLGGFYSTGEAHTEKSCDKAIGWFEKSAQRGYPLAINNLAYTLVTCEDKKLRDPDRAEELVRFLYSANPSLLALLDTYAAVLAAQGDYPQAAKTLEVVLDISSLINANPERIDEMKETLKLYKKKPAKAERSGRAGRHSPPKKSKGEDSRDQEEQSGGEERLGHRVRPAVTGLAYQ